ncbi:MAG: sulfurtransferase complex subunit TusB [Pseudomonadales bacterium]|nr:sulfurtransferase complex subunit TusB [Pseudomonadales bacterium]
MSTLHILNKAPSDNTLILSCSNALAGGDKLILIEDGVYNATTSIHPALKKQLNSNIEIYARQTDVMVRGIKTQIISDIRILDDTEWVALCVESQPIVSWY